jgi:hypothetical protein
MSRVPGLSSFEDDQPERGRPLPQRRVDVDWEGGGVRRMPSLRPQAAPVDMYARPAAQPPADKGLLQLADSLSQLNGALQRFGTVAHEQNERDAAGRIEQARRSMTEEAFQGWLQRPENQATIQSQAGQGVLGQAAAIRRMQALQEEYQTADRDNMNFDEFVRQRMATDLEGKSPTFSTAFSRTIGPQIERMRGQHTEFRAGREREAVEGGLITIYDQTIRDGIAGGATPEQVMEIINARRNGDRRFSAVDYNRSAQLLMRSLRQLSETDGNKDFVEKFLDMPRSFTHSDGRVQQLPSLAQSMPYGEVDAIRNSARQTDARNSQVMASRRLVELTGRASKGELTEDDVREMETLRTRNLLQQDSLISIQNANRRAQESILQQREQQRLINGMEDQTVIERQAMVERATQAIVSGRVGDLRTHSINGINRQTMEPRAQTFTAQQQIDAATESYVTGVEQRLMRQEINPAQAMGELTQWFSRTGGVHENWRRTINSGYTATNLATLTAENGAPSEDLIRSFNLYRELKAVSPDLANRHTSADARAFFDTAAAHYMMRQEPGHALQSAFAANGLTEEQRSARRKEVDTAIRGIRQGGFLGFFGDTLRNPDDPYVLRTVTDRASQFGMTMSAGDAIKAARDSFMQDHRIIAGSAIRISNLTMPNWFEEEVTEYIKFFENHSSSDRHNPGDLTIRRIDETDRFMLVNSRNGVPVDGSGNEDLMPRMFDLGMLERFRTQRFDRLHRGAVNTDIQMREAQPTEYSVPGATPTPTPNPVPRPGEEPPNLFGEGRMPRIQRRRYTGNPLNPQ